MADYVPFVSVQEEVLDFLITAPSPQDIIDFFASENAQLRLRYLLYASRENTLTDAEQTELDESIYLDHFITLLKIKTHKALQKN